MKRAPIVLTAMFVAVACAAPMQGTATPSASAPPPAVAAPPEPAPTTTVTPQPSRTPFAPPPTAPATPGVVARAAKLPADFRLLRLDEFDEARQVLQHRLFALDLSGANGHVEIALWEMPTRGPSTGGWSASRDGWRIALIAAGTTGLIPALYLIDVPTGTVRKLFEDQTVFPAAPVLSPDGSQIATRRLPAQNTASFQVELGIWAGNVDRPNEWKRIAEQEEPKTTVPLAWSSDGRLLAFARLFVDGEVYVVSRDGGTPLAAGRGTTAHWHATEPQLVLAGSGHGGTSVLATFDVATGTARTLLTAPQGTATSPPPWYLTARWHPSGALITYVEGVPLVTQPVTTWTISPDGTAATKIHEGRANGPEWSADGRRLHAFEWSTQSAREFQIVELLTGTRVARGCSHGPILVDPCP